MYAVTMIVTFYKRKKEKGFSSFVKVYKKEERGCLESGCLAIIVRIKLKSIGTIRRVSNKLNWTPWEKKTIKILGFKILCKLELVSDRAKD